MDPLNRKQRRAAKSGSSSSGSESEGEGSGSDSGVTSPKSTPKVAAKKGKRSSKNDDLSEFQQPANVDMSNAGLYVGVAALISFAPAYLYSTVYDLSVSDFGIGYLIAVVASTALLALSYHVVCTYNYAVLSSQRKQNSASPKVQKELGYSAGELESISRDVTARESVLYSLLFNNVVYLVLFFFLAFYMLKDVGTAWNYLSSQVITGGVTYYVATAFSK